MRRPDRDSDAIKRLYAHDWRATAVGPIEDWPPEILTIARMVVEAGFPTVLAWGPELTAVANDAFRDIFGDGRVVTGRPLPAVLATAWDAVAPAVAQAMAGRTAARTDLPFRVARAGSEEDAWFSFACGPVRRHDGTVVGAIGTVIETTDAQRIERARQQIEAQFRMLAEAIDDVFYLTDLDSGELLYLGPAYERVWGRPVAALMADLSTFVDTIHPDDRPAFHAAKAAQARGEAVVEEYRIPRPDGTMRWVLDRCFPVAMTDGSHWSVGVAIDITERKQTAELLRERERGLARMVGELQHRVRNMLAVMRSVFGRSADASRDLDELASHFRGRLDALARTQTIVAKDAARTAELEDLIRDELLRVAALDSPDVRIAGPEVTLTADIAEMLGLAIHELATNAIKFGALGTAGATLTIAWSVDPDQTGARRLVLDWTETGVAALPVAPTRRGFGRELIEEVLPEQLGATTELTFRGGGVRCVIALPLDG